MVLVLGTKIVLELRYVHPSTMRQLVNTSLESLLQKTQRTKESRCSAKKLLEQVVELMIGRISGAGDLTRYCEETAGPE
jgi:hypothetical protein